MSELTVPLWTALVAGIASFFSPCILPVLPGFFAFLGGTASGKRSSRGHVFFATVLFGIGFSLTFFLLGTGVSFLGHPLAVERIFFEKIGGILLIIFGIMLTDLVPFPQLLRSEKLLQNIHRSGSWLRSLLLGSVFGFVWIPCIGPLLGTILYLATGEKTALHGGILLLVFALGIMLPLLILALLVPELRRILAKVRMFAHVARFFFAFVLIFFGILLFLGKFDLVSSWFVEKLGTGLVF